ncbi:hypothetical protein TSUD_221720 [Trifolium subterraneum]|uniref:RNase H type-1 domain-containing protein n=1 Tax=Trifolium subterraneum TaxID=3900 RepID=A0A2Z6N5Z3_TRISU|nr:hypothetical protein TSUD_221720 [Trifolium subterraneum]
MRMFMMQWQQPRDGWWKCSVDASFYGDAGHTSWNWCIRNSQGQFIAAGCNKILEKLTTYEGEIMALLEEIREAVK